MYYTTLTTMVFIVKPHRGGCVGASRGGRGNQIYMALSLFVGGGQKRAVRVRGSSWLEREGESSVESTFGIYYSLVASPCLALAPGMMTTCLEHVG